MGLPATPPHDTNWTGLWKRNHYTNRMIRTMSPRTPLCWLLLTVSVSHQTVAFQFWTVSAPTVFVSTNSLSAERRRTRERRGPPQRRPRRERPVEPEVFDGKALTAAQSPNDHNPPLFDLQAAAQAGTLRCMSDDFDQLVFLEETKTITQTTATTEAVTNDNDDKAPSSSSWFTYHSLDDVTGIAGFSELFHCNATFRNALRTAMRHDIFEATPAYANVQPKVKEIMLLPDSSLQGSWKTPDNTPPRMHQLTKVLQDSGLDLPKNQNNAPGDDLMHALGRLCGGPQPSTHWIDIVGVLDRRITHSWHQDTGTTASRTVCWGFPAQDHYQGCGVFSHLVGLKVACRDKSDDNHEGRNLRVEPVLWDGNIDEQFIVRPEFKPGQEIISYRDIDVLHSSPDVAYRSNLMRFM